MVHTVFLIGTAGVLAVFGVLVKYAGWVELVAGYDSARVDDPEGLGAFVGTNILSVAVLTVLFAGIEYVLAVGTVWYWLGYTAIVCGLAVRMSLGARRYESPPETN